MPNSTPAVETSAKRISRTESAKYLGRSGQGLANNRVCNAVSQNEKCEREKHANGYCGMHDSQIKRRGRIVSLYPDPVRASANLPAIERFARQLKAGGVNEYCWEWQASKDKDGYAWFPDGGKKWRGHRWAWQHFTGRTLSSTIELDHICGNTSCVRPSHLQEVTPSKHREIGQQRKASLKAYRDDTHEWVAGNPLPRSMSELGFGVTRGLPVNFFGSGLAPLNLFIQD